MEQLLANYLMYFIVPLWLAAGLADWFCHRHAHIEATSGPRESLIHLLMLVEMGIPALAALFLEINAAVLIIAFVALAVHEATALWDVSYASARRLISTIEQHVHSYLEIIPLIALSCMVLLHWEQFIALAGGGTASADFTLRLKAEPLPAPYVATLLGAIVILQIVPYMEEWWRGYRRAKALHAASH